MQNNSAIVSVLLPKAFSGALPNPYSLLVAPNKHRIEASFKGCVDVDRPRVLKGFLKSPERFVPNELETWRRLYVIWKFCDYAHVRWTRLRRGVVEDIVDVQV